MVDYRLGEAAAVAFCSGSGMSPAVTATGWTLGNRHRVTGIGDDRFAKPSVGYVCPELTA